MNENINEILKGAVDMHCHSYPEISLEYKSTRQEDFDALEEFGKYEMKGIAFKSNMFPTVTKTYNLKNMISGVSAYGSITLNTVCGGFNPIAVECAAKLGAKIVHMPTWTAQNDFSGDGWYMADLIGEYLKSVKLMKDVEALTVFDKDGTLKKDVIKVMEIAKENKMVTFTGHLSKEESFALIRQAKEMDYDKIVWCHPLTYKATIDELKKTTELGAYVEFNYTWFLPTLQGGFPQIVAEINEAIGPEKIILTSDHFFSYAPSPAECMRMWVATLLEFGVKSGDIRKMIVDNPWKLLDITE